ncbi:type II toxin-antitoxin system RelE/ParE family toxin [uncultured Sphingomonas sp.]|uniref:type II toxin-antitoxin system RelE/ParE family toxin n=1 Tax=uncultured Sphingomonas sp. TaxID=158754 RepID=UPI0035CC6CB2
MQAKTYIRSLYAELAAIADRRRHWRRLPAAFDIDGYFCRYERHLIYWRAIDDMTIGIAAILHQRMQQLDRFRETIGSND